MRVFQAIALLSLMTVPAFSQGMAPTGQSMTPGFRLNEGKEYTEEEKARMKANEDAAKAARAKLPDAKANSDPWAGARASETPAPKAVKPKAATQ
jgi:hypothetical protein